MTHVLLAASCWDLSGADVLIRVAAGLVIGFTIGLTGIGGGVLVMPALIQLFGSAPSLAAPTANFYSVMTKAHAGYEHLKLNTIRRRTAFWFLVGGIPVDVVVTGVLRLNRAHQWISVATLETGLYNLVIGAMVAAGAAVAMGLMRERRMAADDHYQPAEAFDASRKVKAMLCGAVIGFLIGSTSIGGGVLVIPMLSIVFILSPKDTVGTSVAISIVLAFVSALFFFVGNVRVPYAESLTTAVLMFVGSIPGVTYGSRLAVRVKPRVLYALIAMLILVAIASMLFGPEQVGH